MEEKTYSMKNNFAGALKDGKFQTMNRSLERFLYLHKIRFENWFKNEDGMTVWTYRPTDHLAHCLNEYSQTQVKGRYDNLAKTSRDFKIGSQKMETFLFVHGIYPAKVTRDSSFNTVWHYDVDTNGVLQEIVDEYRTIYG